MNGKKKNKKGTAAKIKYKKKKSWNKNKGKITNGGMCKEEEEQQKKGVELERVNEVLELLCV